MLNTTTTILPDQDENLEILEDTEQEAITNDLMLEYLDNTIEYMDSFDECEKIYRRERMSFPSSKAKRSEVYVSYTQISKNRNYGEVVDSLDRFRKMISNIVKFIPETGYHGTDSDHIKLIRGILPETYEARVAYIKLRHLPDELVNQDNVILRCEKLRIWEKKILIHEEDVANAYCKIIPPFLTNKNLFYKNKNQIIKPQFIKNQITKSEILMREYHCISFKVYPNGLLKSWDVGRDREAELVLNPLDQYVMLGTKK